MPKPSARPPRAAALSTDRVVHGLACLAALLATGLLMVELGSAEPGWVLGAVFPLGLISLILMNVQSAGRRAPGWLAWGFGLIVLAIFVSRTLYLQAVPWPGGVQHGAIETAATLVAGWVLWTLAARQPTHALLIWLASLGLACITQGAMRGLGGLSSPDFFLPSISLGLGLLLWGLFQWPVLGRGLIAPFLFAVMAALGLGAGLAMFQQASGGELGAFLSGLRYREALAQAWSQSAVWGWGTRLTPRAAEVFVLPFETVPMAWSGPRAFVAQWGIAGLAAAAVTVSMLITHARRVMRGGGGLAAAMTLLHLGVLFAGGPQAHLSLVIAVGWGALAFAALWPHRVMSEAGSLGWMRLATAPVMVMVMGLVCFAPLWGWHLYQRALGEPGGSPARQSLLLSAQRWWPSAPAIARTLAMDALTGTVPGTGSDSSYYRQVKFTYEQAIRLDPFDPNLPMRLAQFHLRREREEEAVDVMLKALERAPARLDWVDWLMLLGERANRPQLAYRMAEHGWRLRPDDPARWAQLLEMARRSGQGPLAGRLAAILLTQQPDDPERLAQFWSLRQTSRGAPPIDPDQIGDASTEQTP